MKMTGTENIQQTGNTPRALDAIPRAADYKMMVCSTLAATLAPIVLHDFLQR
jgi:hypothetical protein